ncbi:MAG: ECF transporter S component [bacterium]|nr:ECF transporter S component [bacterium]
MNEKKKKIWTTQTLIVTAMLAALAGVLMSLEIPLPMMPPFYKLDFSDVPSLIALFLMGPVQAVCVEVMKVLIKLVTIGTSSAFVGDLANLIAIVMYIFPLWFIFKKLGKTTSAGIIAMCVSVPLRVAFACFCNACITLPLYAKAMEMPLDGVIKIVAAVNPSIHNLTTFIVLATIPFNILKIGVNYLVGYLLYNRLTKISFVKQGIMS